MEENPKNVSTIQERIFHKTFFKNMDLFLHLTSLLSDLEKMTNPLQNPLRYIIIDSFSLTSYPIIDFTEYDIWISAFSRIFKILNNKYYIGILVIKLIIWKILILYRCLWLRDGRKRSFSVIGKKEF